MSTKSDSEAPELYRRYRPTTFKQVVGQEAVTRELLAKLKSNTLPHALLFTGPSGCGKTTIARILKEKLECSDQDFQEINGAEARGIDTVRDIKTRMTLRPLAGKVRICYIDECHKLTNEAQNSLLKMLEDTPSHFYFILATTDPQKLIKTIITRCTEFRTRELSPEATRTLLRSVSEKEGIALTEDAEEKIIENAMGSARLALVLLAKLAGLTDAQEQVDAIEKTSGQAETIALCRALLSGASWPELAKIVRTLEAEPESVRWTVLGYMQSVAMGKEGKPANPKMAARAFTVIEAFQYNYFDTKKAGLCLSCFTASGAR